MFLLTVWTLVAAVTFVPAKEDDNMVIFVWRSRPNKKHLHTNKSPNIQFRVLDTLEEQSLWKKRRKTPA